MSETNVNLWAPWRMEYVEQIVDGDQACFLCQYWNAPESDIEDLVVWRTDLACVLMNRFPYTSGHLLVAPGAHQAGLSDLRDEQMLEVMRLVRDAQTLLAHVLKPQGYNVGMNFGRCAGAGLPGHLHVHVVPRWSGDTNFMTALSGVRVLPEALDRLYDRLCRASAELAMPYRTPER